MYKILFFLHKTTEKGVLKFFNEKLIGKLSEITGNDVPTAAIESNLLLEQKYELYCEISAGTKEEMDKMMNTKAGKELNKLLTDFHQNMTIITVNYNK